MEAIRTEKKKVSQFPLIFRNARAISVRRLPSQWRPDIIQRRFFQFFLFIFRRITFALRFFDFIGGGCNKSKSIKSDKYSRMVNEDPLNCYSINYYRYWDMRCAIARTMEKTLDKPFAYVSVWKSGHDFANHFISSIEHGFYYCHCLENWCALFIAASSIDRTVKTERKVKQTNRQKWKNRIQNDETRSLVCIKCFRIATEHWTETWDEIKVLALQWGPWQPIYHLLFSIDLP